MRLVHPVGSRSWIHVPVICVAVGLLATASAGEQVVLASPLLSSPTASQSLTLDGVPLVVSTVTPIPAFSAALPTDAVQAATSTQYSPYRAVTITTVPFGTAPAGQPLPLASSGGAGAYRASLTRARTAQGRTASGVATSALLFGAAIPGAESRVLLSVAGVTPSPVDVAEWVTQAGSRLWIVDAEQQVAQASAPLTQFGPLTITSTDPQAPSRMLQTIGTKDATSRTSSSTTTQAVLDAAGTSCSSSGVGNGNLTTGPCWWPVPSAPCPDYAGNAYAPLGGNWMGVYACGPIPVFNNAGYCTAYCSIPTIGGWSGNLGWQCVELSGRFMVLAYGVSPVNGNGNGLAPHYASAYPSLFSYITPGLAASQQEMPEPGDIVSLDYGTNGHTYVVTGATPGATAGTETITIIEENWSASGTRTLSVTNWGAISGGGSALGWAQPIINPFTTPSAPTLGMASDYDAAAGQEDVFWNQGGQLWVTSFVGSNRTTVVGPQSAYPPVGAQLTSDYNAAAGQEDVFWNQGGQLWVASFVGSNRHTVVGPQSAYP